MSLATELREFEQSRRASRDPKLTAKMDDATQQLANSGILNSSLKLGQQAPEFMLPNLKNEIIQLRDALKANHFVILSFYRGGWCPYCNIALRHLQQHLKNFQQHGASLITISPQLPDESLTTAEKNALEFEVLSDINNKVARDYGLVFTLPETLREMYGNPNGINLPKTNGSDSFELPIPATYVINSKGIIIYAFADPDYTKRAEPSDIIKAIEAST